jgi:hypothetical protein
MPTRVGLVLPPQLLESARAAQLANRQRLLAREARERLRDRAQLQAEKARAATGLPLWPGAVPEVRTEQRGRLWTRRQRLMRGVITHGFYQVYGQDINSFTVNRIIRIYSLSGSSYSEYGYTYQNLGALLGALRHPASVGSAITDSDAKLATYPVSESSFVMVEINAKTTTPIINTGVETIVGGIGPAAAAIIDANPYRNFLLYTRTEQNWAIFAVYLLGQDAYELGYRAWLVHQSGVKEITVPQQFIQQATAATMQTTQGDYYTGPVIPGSGTSGRPDEPPRAVLRTTGNRLAFTKAAQRFTAGTYGLVQVPPIVSVTPPTDPIFSYATDGALFNDYEEPIIPQDLAGILANPPFGTSLAFPYRFSTTMPNSQALPRAPIAYLQDLGFSTADLTP